MVLTPTTAIIGLIICVFILKIVIKFIVSNIVMDCIRLKYILAKMFVVLDCFVPFYILGYIARTRYNVSMVKVLLGFWIFGYSFYLLFMTKETQGILYIIFGSVWGYALYDIFAAPNAILGSKLYELLITYNINIDCLAYKAVMSGLFIYILIRWHFFFRNTSSFTQYYLFKRNKNKKRKHIDADLPADNNTTTP